MGGLFGGSSPKIPDPVAPPAPPATSDAAITADNAAERLRRRRGTAATILAGENAIAPSASIAAKTLLGQ